jgi:hypothetical protein
MLFQELKMFGNKELKPYKKILKDIERDISSLSFRIDQLWRISFNKTYKAIENDIQELESKLDSMKDTLSYQNDDFKKLVNEEFGDRITSISSQIEDLWIEYGEKAAKKQGFENVIKWTRRIITAVNVVLIIIGSPTISIDSIVNWIKNQKLLGS